MIGMTARAGAARRYSAKSSRRVKRTRKIVLNSTGVIVALLVLFPIFWMLSTAFKPPTEILSLTPHPLPAHPTLGNFTQVINGSASGSGGAFWTFFRNSIFVTVCAVVLASALSLLAAVAVARFRFRLRTSFLIMLLIVQMVPGNALVIPLFLDFRSLNLLDSLTGLILLYAGFALPVSIWLLRNFVATVPKELEEAAAIDGASPARIFWRILFPLVWPGLVAVSTLAFITAWNEFVFALTFLSSQGDYTLPIYIGYFFGRGSAAWGPIMAASTLYTIPPVAFFLIVQRRMVGGLVAGAVKG
ncbi:MAG TPA: carbohydrate ABC transporter permease [Streptosporangiaceae bacterium]|jgi:N,N'-diacetylchitobiose transport system permease protein|nr:carbohydrate ABC transporter permease [Streptosporangiaceae bacterium]